jgi:hypothetical protein
MASLFSAFSLSSLHLVLLFQARMFCFKIELLSVFIHENGGKCTQPVAAAGTTARIQLSLTQGGNTSRRFSARGRSTHTGGKCAAKARTLEDNERQKHAHWRKMRGKSTHTGGKWAAEARALEENAVQKHAHWRKMSGRSTHTGGKYGTEARTLEENERQKHAHWRKMRSKSTLAGGKCAAKARTLEENVSQKTQWTRRL